MEWFTRQRKKEKTMRASDEPVIRVQSAWNGWRTAEVRIDDLQDVHWFQPTYAPHTLLHGYIACSDIVTGDLQHDCDPRSAPHRLLVCVLKTHAIASVYAELAGRAGDQRSGQWVDPARAGLRRGATRVAARRR
jgi:hypothetical protein